METEIIRANLQDLDALREIVIKTFTESFATLNSEEDFGQYLQQSFSQERLTSELTNNDSEFYFAISNKEVIGYLKVNFRQAQTELKESKGLEIERIYVLQRFQGKKIGQLILDKTIQIAKQTGMAYVWLGVWEKNAGAIRFYQKNGFKTFDSHIYKIGSDKQIDLMMRLSLDHINK